MSIKTALIQAPAWGRDCPPYTLAYLKALLNSCGYEAHLFDINNSMYHASSGGLKKYWDDKDYYSHWEQHEKLMMFMSENAGMVDKIIEEILNTDAAVIGFTTHTTSFIISLELARRIKKRDKKKIIVFGGPQCSRSQAAVFLAHQPQVDYVCAGEGDIALPELLKTIGKGRKGPLQGFLYRDGDTVIDGGDPSIPENLDRLPYPDYEPFRAGIEGAKYREPNRLDIFDSRGCTTCCHFCSEWQFWKKYRTMSGKRIFDEIAYQIKRFPQVNYFYFNGSLINGDLKVLEEWCDRLIKSGLKIKWAGQAIAREAMSRELIFKMKESGCCWLGYGIESGSQSVLNKMNKRYSVKDAVRVLRDTHEAGISVQINLMFGMPTETREDYEETLSFFRKVRPYIDSVLASQSFCVLDKGTYLHKNPGLFGITGEEHHLYWKSDSGKNNYEERFKRYEEFCKEALSLGIPETSGVLSNKPDKWFLLGCYYKHDKDYIRAAECFKRAMGTESQDENVLKELKECMVKMNERIP